MEDEHGDRTPGFAHSDRAVHLKQKQSELRDAGTDEEREEAPQNFRVVGHPSHLLSTLQPAVHQVVDPKPPILLTAARVNPKPNFEGLWIRPVLRDSPIYMGHPPQQTLPQRHPPPHACNKHFPPPAPQPDDTSKYLNSFLQRLALTRKRISH